MTRAQLRFALVVLCLLAPAQTPPPKRRALLIANSGYRLLPPLPSAAQDAAVLEPALKDLGFEVTIERDLTLDKMLVAEGRFEKAIQPGDVCFFYYAGYAIQVNNENFLLPFDYDPGSPQSPAYNFVRLPQMLEDRKAGVKILALDASHENAKLRVRASGPGLATVAEPGTHMIIAYSAMPSQTAPAAPAAGPSLFAQALVAKLKTPGLDIVDLFREVGAEVAQSSGGRQQPFILPFISEKSYLRPELPKPKVEPPKPIIITRAPDPNEPVVGRPETNSDRLEYAYIPPAEFWMGCVAGDRECEENEKPRHKVKISRGFWMGRTEVTVGAYKRFAGESGRKLDRAPEGNPNWRDDSHPIVRVSWEEAKAYCEWAGGRLPTEAEWEYAARAGLENEIYPFHAKDRKASREKANFQGKGGADIYDYTAPVQRFDRSPFYLHDMSGNVWEWCSDWFSETYYRESPEVDPRGPSAASKAHVVRGGSWYSDPDKHLLISFRYFREDRANHVGFRCVLDDTPETRARFRTAMK